MTEPVPGGRRRIDRVLAEDFLGGIEDISLEDLRERRHDAEQEEADLSYTRRMLQGRMDILRAELGRRAGSAAGSAAGSGDDGGLVERLSTILADSARSDHGLGRYITVEPSRVAETRRAVEQVIADIGVSETAGRTDEELRDALSRLEEFERGVSSLRQRVQTAMDACTGEIARRYREGVAKVDDLLAGG